MFYGSPVAAQKTPEERISEFNALKIHSSEEKIKLVILIKCYRCRRDFLNDIIADGAASYKRSESGK